MTPFLCFNVVPKSGSTQRKTSFNEPLSWEPMAQVCHDAQLVGFNIWPSNPGFAFGWFEISPIFNLFSLPSGWKFLSSVIWASISVKHWFWFLGLNPCEAKPSFISTESFHENFQNLEDGFTYSVYTMHSFIATPYGLRSAQCWKSLHHLVCRSMQRVHAAYTWIPTCGSLPIIPGPTEIATSTEGTFWKLHGYNIIIVVMLPCGQWKTQI